MIEFKRFFTCIFAAVAGSSCWLGDSPTNHTGEFAIGSHARIEGRVLTLQNNPVFGARVYYHLPPDRLEAPALNSASDRTDSLGEYSLLVEHIPDVQDSVLDTLSLYVIAAVVENGAIVALDSVLAPINFSPIDSMPFLNRVNIELSF